MNIKKNFYLSTKVFYILLTYACVYARARTFFVIFFLNIIHSIVDRSFDAL